MEHSQLCPLAKATEVLGERWTFLVIRALLLGADRFNEIRRSVPLMSPSLLSQRLQRLEREGIVGREPLGSGHRYSLTQAGQELAPIVHSLGWWGERWILGHVDRRKPEVTTLMWAVRRRVDPTAFGDRRTVIRFEFTDQPPASRFWWVINEPSAVDLCLKDPGFEVDLYITTDVQTMADVWVGAVGFSAAINTERLQLDGARPLSQVLRTWLLLSPLASQSDQKTRRPSQSASLRAPGNMAPAK